MGINYWHQLKTIDSIEDWEKSALPVLLGRGANYARVLYLQKNFYNKLATCNCINIKETLIPHLLQVAVANGSKTCYTKYHEQKSGVWF